MLQKLGNFRFILYNHQYMNKKTVLDVGFDRGACSVTLVIVSQVIANGIDPDADKYFYCNYLFFIVYTLYLYFLLYSCMCYKPMVF